MKSNLLKNAVYKNGKVIPFAKKCLSLALAVTLVFPVWGGVLHEPVKVMAQQAFVPITNLEVSLKEAVVGQRYELNLNTISKVEPETATNKTNPKWMIFYPYGMDIEIEGDKKSNVTAFTPKEEGYIWLYVEMQLGAKPTHTPWTTDGNFKQFFKLPVKTVAGGAEPNVYPPVAKDKLKPLKTPLSMGWFRTWHDYWTEAAWAEASNKFGNAPEEVDIMAIFPDYTSPDNPFWEILKNEYVPTLNARGTRVIRTIGMQDVIGRRGVSVTFSYEKNEEGYRRLAEKIVEEYVDKYDLDGLDIDFENENKPENQAEKEQGIAVIQELAKMIGKKSSRPNTIFMIDTDLRFDNSPDVFSEILPHVDFVARQNYRHEGSESYDSFSNYIRKDQFISGFSFYEEGGNQWNNIPRADLVADRNTNETKIDNPDELLKNAAFKACDAYKQADWISKGGYGGIAAYAIDRDGVAHGNNKKFFHLSEGGHPTKYYVSKALKHLMLYNNGKDVESITGVPETFNVGGTLTLTGTVNPTDAVKNEIEWEIVQEQDKTTAQGAAITEKNKLTATGIGKITVKATVKDSVKTDTPLEYQDFSKEFEIAVTATPRVIDSYLEVIENEKKSLEEEKQKKERLEKERQEKEKLEKEKLEKEKLEKEKAEKEKLEEEKAKAEQEILSKKSEPIKEVIKAKSETTSVKEDIVRKVLEAEDGKIQVKLKSTIVSISKAVMEKVFDFSEEVKDIQVFAVKSKLNKLDLKKLGKKLSDKKLLTNIILSVNIKMGEENLNDYDLDGNMVQVEVKTALKKLPKTVYVVNLDTGIITKAKYNKKTKKITFKVHEVGNFVLVKNVKKAKIKK